MSDCGLDWAKGVVLDVRCGVDKNHYRVVLVTVGRMCAWEQRAMTRHRDTAPVKHHDY